jgi:hypothetical protein
MTPMQLALRLTGQDITAGAISCTTLTASGLLSVNRSVSSASTEYGGQVYITQNGTGIGYGLDISVTANGAGAASSAASVYAKAATQVGDRDHIVSFQGRSTHNSPGTLTDLYGAALYCGTDPASGAVTNIKFIEINTPTIGGAAPTNLYGIYIKAMSGAMNNYSIYTEAGTARFGGDVSIASGYGLYIASGVRIAGTATVTNFYSGSSSLGFYSQDGGTQFAAFGNSSGDLSLTSTTAATSPTVAALTVAGGLGVVGDGFFGGGLVMSKASGQGILVDPASPTAGWRDKEGSYLFNTTGANSPAIAAYRGGVVRALQFIANDRIDVQFHMPHDWMVGTDMHIHVHWSHNGTAITGNASFQLNYTYAKGHNQANFPAEKQQTITYATTNIATTPQYRHRIDEVQLTDASGSGNYLNRGDLEVDGLILASLTLTALPTITGGGLFIHFIDIHYQSTNIGTKNKAPGFYT